MAESASSPDTSRYAAMSVKQLTAALEEREEKFVETTKSIRKLEAETMQAESKAFKSEEEHNVELMEVDRQASSESALASEAQRLAKELRALSMHREDVEARHSYGAFSRWRQRLHMHLGCTQEDVDKGLEWLLPRGNGSVPSSEAVKVNEEARQWKQRVEDVKAALVSSEQKVFDLGRSRDKAELEWMRLGLDLTQQKQWASEWWQYHLSQMPEYQQQHVQINGQEARSAELAADLKQSLLQLEELRAVEGPASLSVAESQRELAESEELEVEVSQELFEVSEEAASLRRKIAPGGIPGDEDGIPLVQSWKQRLLKCTQEAEKLEREAHEAKQEEKALLSLAVDKEREIDEIGQRIKRVEKNADLLALRFKEQTRRLGERDREQQRLVRASRDVALDMERNRSVLSSWGALRERRDSAGAGRMDAFENEPTGRLRSSPRPSDSVSQQRLNQQITSPTVNSTVRSSDRRSSSVQLRSPNANGAVDQAQASRSPEAGRQYPRSRSRSISQESRKQTSSSGNEVHDIWTGTVNGTARSQSASRSRGSRSETNGSQVKPHQIESAVGSAAPVGAFRRDSTQFNSAIGSAVAHGHVQGDLLKPSRGNSKNVSPRPSLEEVGNVAGFAPKPVPLKTKRPL